MKKRIMFFLVSLFCCLGMMAQADKIVGTYYAESGGKVSHVKIFKYQDGYRAQVCWLKEPNNPDGSPKLDTKNPDKAKAKLRADQAVLIEKITYDKDDKEWSGGKIYNPEDGKTWKVVVKFKDDKTLQVRGSFMGIGKTVYWPKLD